MRRTALILAGAAAFDLGVMVVTAQARPVQDPPTTRRGAVTDPSGTRDCTDRRPGVPCTAGPAPSPALQADGKFRHEYVFIKIDAALPLRACIARRGEVVEHEGVRQCRLPAADAGAIENPNRSRPGGVPPRN